MKYRKKPVVIEAVRYDGGEDSIIAIMQLSHGNVLDRLDHLDIVTLEGIHRADKGDIIIRGVKGELYPCKPDIFELTYEKV